MMLRLGLLILAIAVSLALAHAAPGSSDTAHVLQVRSGDPPRRKPPAHGSHQGFNDPGEPEHLRSHEPEALRGIAYYFKRLLNDACRDCLRECVIKKVSQQRLSSSQLDSR